jgi:hypothetical protein
MIKVPPPIIQPEIHSLSKYYVKATYTARIEDIDLEIPKGFVFDGASLPRPFWAILGHPMTPQYCTAALIHDFLYQGKLPRHKADKIFRTVLKDHGTPNWKAQLMYRGVRLFGWIFYGKFQRPRFMDRLIFAWNTERETLLKLIAIATLCAMVIPAASLTKHIISILLPLPY